MTIIPYHIIPSSRRLGQMLCYPFEQERLEKWNPPYLVQPKLDGDRARIRVDKTSNIAGSIELLSSEENSFNHTVPHIVTAYESMIYTFGILPEIDGELYKHGMSQNEIFSRVSTSRVSLHEDYQSIEFHYFDLVEEGPQYKRLSNLGNLNLPYPFVKVPVYTAMSITDVMRIYDKILDAGYEGIVVRHIDNLYIRRRSTMVMKFKPKKDDIYPICGWKEETTEDGTPKGRIGSIACVKDGQIFSVSAGLNDEMRNELWKIREQLPGKMCKVYYQAITTKRRFPKFVSKIEILESDPGINPMIDFGS